MVVFSPIFVEDTKINFGYSFVGPLKQLWNYNQKLFLCALQKWTETTSILGCYFFMAYVFHMLSTYRKINLLLISSTELVFSSLEIQSRLIQAIILYHSYMSEKKRLANLQKHRNCENLFLQCVCYCYNLLR